MARHEADREDLIREAVALSERLELRCGPTAEIVTIGFRRTGGCSIFVEQDPVYQFDVQGRLRRAFVQGLLYRSQHSTLAQLRRQRTPHATQLLRHDLGPEELQEFRRTMHATLQTLLLALQTGSVTVLRAVPEDATDAILQRIRQTLQQILGQSADWLSSAIHARRL